jgi:hypothetical protein
MELHPVKPEADTPPSENCGNCRFCFCIGIHKEGLKKILECRRYPPHPQAIPNANGLGTLGMFPPTRPELSCGEWSAKRQVLQ